MCATSLAHKGGATVPYRAVLCLGVPLAAPPTFSRGSSIIGDGGLDGFQS